MMKKIIFLGVILLLVSCNKQSANQKEVYFTIDYYFPESGSMYTKASSGDIAYQTFKDNCIDTRKVMPTKYEITFTNEDTGEITNIKGHWNKKEGFRLPAGSA